MAQPVVASEATNIRKCLHSVVWRKLAQMDGGKEMERAKGFEPSTQLPQTAQNKPIPETAATDYTQIRAQVSVTEETDRVRLFERWPSLPLHAKAAILSIIELADGGAR